MIDGEGEVRLEDGDKLILRGIPTWDLAARAHPQDEGLFWQRDRSGPCKAKGAEIGHGGNGAAGGLGGKAALAGQLDQFVVGAYQVSQGPSVCAAKDRH